MPTVTIKNRLTGKEYAPTQEEFDAMSPAQKKCFTVLATNPDRSLPKAVIKDKPRVPEVVERTTNKGKATAPKGGNNNG